MVEKGLIGVQSSEKKLEWAWYKTKLEKSNGILGYKYSELDRQ